MQSSPHIGVLVLTMMEEEDRCSPPSGPARAGYLLKGARRQRDRALDRGGRCRGRDLRSGHRGSHDDLLPGYGPSRPAGVPQLTDRERVILGRIAGGLENAEIARELGLSVKTVRNHTSNIFAKLQVAHRAQAIILAREAGIESSRRSMLLEQPRSTRAFCATSRPMRCAAGRSG